jgi:hypothetical protein
MSRHRHLAQIVPRCLPLLARRWPTVLLADLGVRENPAEVVLFVCESAGPLAALVFLPVLTLHSLADVRINFAVFAGVLPVTFPLVHVTTHAGSFHARFISLTCTRDAKIKRMASAMAATQQDPSVMRCNRTTTEDHTDSEMAEPVASEGEIEGEAAEEGRVSTGGRGRRRRRRNS